jgi:hypothetical protein
MKLLITRDKINTISENLSEICNSEWLDTLGEECNLIKRKRNLDGNIFAKIFILVNDGGSQFASITQLCAKAQELGARLVSSSMQERFVECAELFMKEVCERVISKQIMEASELNTLEEFSEIMLQDSTNINLPDSLKDEFKGSGGVRSKATMKLDFSIDLKSGYCKIGVRSGIDNDTKASMSEIKKGSLWLRDLGYFTLDRFREIKSKGAFFLSRVKSSLCIYAKADSKEVIDIEAVVKKMAMNEVKDMEVFVGEKNRLGVRLTIQKVPQDVAEERRASLKKEYKSKGKKPPSDKTLFWCGINVLISNLCLLTYTGQRLLNMYKIRWTIEIFFKIWKSIFNLGKVGTNNRVRLMCQLYGKLIYICLQQKVFFALKIEAWNRKKLDLSEIKMFKIMAESRALWQQAIKTGSKKLFEKILETLLEVIETLGKKQTRRKNKNQLVHSSDDFIYG